MLASKVGTRYTLQLSRQELLLIRVALMGLQTATQQHGTPNTKLDVDRLVNQARDLLDARR